MADSSQVHWYEGLFLQPHHLQVMQHRLLAHARARHQISSPYPFGLVQAALSPDALLDSTVRFTELRLVMPGGMYIDVPGNADLPAREFSRALSGRQALRVSIGVPFWDAGRGNAVENGLDPVQSKRLYRVGEPQMLPDENTGTNPQPMLFRRINARLLFGDENTSELDVLPLFQIRSPAAGHGARPSLDETYYPPTLVMEGWAPLLELVTKLSEAVSSARKAEAAELGQSIDMESVKPTEVAPLLRVWAFNQFAPRLTQLVRAPRVTPFQMYLELRQLLGALATGAPADDAEVPEYDHDNLAVVFQHLDSEIRSRIVQSVHPRFTEVRFTPQGDRFIAPSLDPALATLPDHYLAIRSNANGAALIELVHRNNDIKLVPTERIKRFAVPGVTLRFEHQPPAALPNEVGLSYFRVVRSDVQDQQLWGLLQREGMTVIWRNVGVDAAKASVSLFAMLPKGAP